MNLEEKLHYLEHYKRYIRDVKGEYDWYLEKDIKLCKQEIKALKAQTKLEEK